MTLYTPEDLLQYLYKETSPDKTAGIEKALAEDWSLREKFKILQTSANRVDAAIESPRTEVVLRILNYARETVVQPA